MNLNDIRPKELLVKQKEALAQDIDWLMSRKADFLPVSCPACGSIKSREAFSKYGTNYFHCLKCKTIYMNPRPSPDILREYYKQSKNNIYWAEYIFPATEEKRYEEIFIPRVKRLIELHTTGTLVDIGAGFGTFCRAASDSFDKVIAIEPSPKAAETCRKHGLETIESPLEQIDTLHSVDVVTSFEVIEHIFSPIIFLQKIHSFLKKDGILMLTCPNGLSFEIAQLKEKSTAIDIEHLNLFNPNSIYLLLKKVGFDIISITTPGKLDAELVREAALHGYVGTMGIMLVENWDRIGSQFQQYLVDTLQASHMQVIGRRK